MPRPRAGHVVVKSGRVPLCWNDDRGFLVAVAKHHAQGDELAHLGGLDARADLPAQPVAIFALVFQAGRGEMVARGSMICFGLDDPLVPDGARPPAISKAAPPQSCNTAAIFSRGRRHRPPCSFHSRRAAGYGVRRRPPGDLRRSRSALRSGGFAPLVGAEDFERQVDAGGLADQRRRIGVRSCTPSGTWVGMKNHLSPLSWAPAGGRLATDHQYMTAGPCGCASASPGARTRRCSARAVLPFNARADQLARGCARRRP